jgi:flavin-dependent dehydrogenase
MDIAGGEQFDVIVVGAGNAATCAALSARESGARVLMLEVAPEEARGGNSCFTGGAFRVVYHGFGDLARLIPASAITSSALSRWAPIPRKNILTIWAG